MKLTNYLKIILNNMEQLIYIGKVTLLFSALYSVYFLLFKNTTFFQINRWYLLLIIPFSFLLPLINGSGNIDSFYAITLPPIELNSVLNQSSYLSILDIVSIVYIIVSIILGIKLIYNLLRISIKINKLKNGVKSKIAPFSFFNFIYIPEELDEDSKKDIIAHEKVHAEQLHSLDIVAYEFLKVVMWFNPLVWLAAYSVKCNHEFIADSIASKNNKEKYSSILIAQLLGVNCSMLANNFNYKPLIKRRIIMMKTTKTKRTSVLKYALVIPVALIFATVNVNQKAYAKPIVKINNQEGVKDKVEVMPEFKGGMDALIKYMGANIKYPKESKKEGTVYVSFVVDEKGKITNAEITKSVVDVLDKEALRVVKNMPNWKPGKDKGKNVKVKMTLPISFKLS